jgi:hypothetical protein
VTLIYTRLTIITLKIYLYNSPNRIIQNIPQNRPSKNSRKPPSQHLGHVCCKRFCSISPNRFGHFSKTSPKTGHPRIHANRLPNIWAIFWKILKNRFRHFSKTSPKTSYPRIRANRLPNFCDLFCIFSPIYKSAA